MHQRPSHEGNVTVKNGDKWEKIGVCVVWDAEANGDGSVSGVLTVGNVKYSFRAWRRRLGGA